MQFFKIKGFVDGWLVGAGIVVMSVIKLLFTFPILPFTILGILGFIIIKAKKRR